MQRAYEVLEVPVPMAETILFLLCALTYKNKHPPLGAASVGTAGFFFVKLNVVCAGDLFLCQ